MISFEDFKKLEIRIGKVISAERIPDSDKLIKFQFDVGDGERQIIAGIAESFPDPLVLIGKEVPLILNLEPKKIRGYVSEGMMLVTIHEDGRAVLLHPDGDVKPGSVVR